MGGALGTAAAVLGLGTGSLQAELEPSETSSPHFSVSCCLSMTIQFQNFQTIVCLKLVRKKNLYKWEGGVLETTFDV